MQHNVDRWLVAPKLASSGLKLYCFPPAGGGAATYRLWPERLAPDMAVYRVQPPGRESRFREPFCDSLDEYVEPLAEHIASEDEPFALFGHSMGSIAAFETARATRALSGRQPHHLFVSAFMSPDAAPAPAIHHLPTHQFVSEIRSRYGGIPDELLEHPEVLEIMLPIVRADLALLNAYRYRPAEYLTCPITALGGISDHWAREADILEWKRMTSGSFSLHLLPGGHFYLDSALSDLMNIVKKTLSV